MHIIVACTLIQLISAGLLSTKGMVGDKAASNEGKTGEFPKTGMH